MPNKILLSADTPCDIGPELQEKYHVSLYPLHILLDDKQYTDGKDITLEQIYQAWWDHKALPRTAAVNPDEYSDYFYPLVKQGFDVIHISLGSGLSSSCQNAKIAAGFFPEGRVSVIDSHSLSTGFGLLVCEAGERIAAGMSIPEILPELESLAMKTSASFLLDTLEFLKAGGRCSTLAALGAGLMQIKPAIQVKNDLAGSMVVGKKYMGKWNKCILKYVEDQLKDRDDIVLDRVFITYSTIEDPAILESVKDKVLSLQPFHNVFFTRASCTIGSHCGPNTLGVLFLTK